MPYIAILTTLGQAKIATAISTGTPVAPQASAEVYPDAIWSP